MAERNKILSNTNKIVFTIVWVLLVGTLFLLIGAVFYASSYWYGDVPQKGVSYFYWGVVWSPISFFVVIIPIIAFFYFLIRWIIHAKRDGKGTTGKGVLVASLLLLLSCVFFNIPFHYDAGTHHDSITHEGQRYHLSYGTTGWSSGDCLTQLTLWECDQFGLMCQGFDINRGAAFFDYVDCGPNHPPNSEQLPSLAVDSVTDELYLDFEEGRVLVNEL